MQLSLMRKDPVDRAFSGDDLRALTQVVMDAAATLGKPAQTVSIRASLWGFERSLGPALYEQFAAELGEAVSLCDPDTLVLTSPPLEKHGNEAPTALASYLDILTQLQAESMLAELDIRLTLPGEATERVFVLHGTLDSGRFVLESVWKRGAGEFDDSVYGAAVWQQEKKLLQNCFDFTKGKSELDKPFCLELFPDNEAQTVGGGIVWLLTYKTPAEWFLRLALMAGTSLGAVALLLSGMLRPLSLILLLVAILGGLAFLFILGLRLYMIRFAYSRMKDANSKLYSAPMTFSPVDLSTNPIAQNDIALRKLTRDVEALGCTFVDDVEPSFKLPGMGSFLRVFRTEEGAMLALILLHQTDSIRLKPAKANFLIRTELEDGTRCVTINNDGGYRHPIPGLKVIARVFTRALHPADLLRKHRHVVALTEERLGVRKREMAAEELIPSEVANHDELCEAMKKVGYFSLGDAWRMAFQSPLPLYQRDEID